MKRFFLLMAVVFGSLLCCAQTNQMVWNNGRMQYAAPIANVDSLTFPNEVLESDTLHFILPRSMKQVVHDTIYQDKLVYVRDTIYINPNALEGSFSVAADKKVCFSKGNLQYTRSTKKWEFANEQYEIVGDANVSNDTLADKIDLFGWSANNTTAPWGVSTSTDFTDYSGDFVDLGKNFGNTWRTLSEEEWIYLFRSRTSAGNKYGVARINLTDDGSQYVNGLILLPDDWTCPSDITFKKGVADSDGSQYYADYQTFTMPQWQQLEQAGAVFLPTSGLRSGLSVNAYILTYGSYWTSTEEDANSAASLNFSSQTLHASLTLYRFFARSVRLVHDL